MSSSQERQIGKVVAVTGIAAITPLGKTVGETWNGLTLGSSGLTRLEGTQYKDLKSLVAGVVPDFDPLTLFKKPNIAKRHHRAAQFATQAVGQALMDGEFLDYKLNGMNPRRIGVYGGTGFGGGDHFSSTSELFQEGGVRKIKSDDLFSVLVIGSEAVASVPADLFGLKGPTAVISTACASGSSAIINAARIIQLGQADIMMAVGSEASIHPVVIGGFEAMGALATKFESPESASKPFDNARDGFVMSEGAGAVMLESYDHAKARGVRVYGILQGYSENSGGEGSEAAPSVETEQLTMSDALDMAQLDPSEVDFIYTHGTSTGFGDKAELEAIGNLFSEYSLRPKLIIIKSLLGHTIGASGPIALVCACLSIKYGKHPYNPNLNDPMSSEFLFNTIKYDHQPEERNEIGLIPAYGFHKNHTALVLMSEKRFLEQCREVD